MSPYFYPLEMHVHGEVKLRSSIATQKIHEALRPLWEYAGASSFTEGCKGLYEEEPGMVLESASHILSLCWTVGGSENFCQKMEEACMNLNELSEEGASLEVTFYDVLFNEDDERDDYENSRDDFMLFFVGPTPAAIMQVQRTLLVQDVLGVMERHFDSSELGSVVQAIDQLFERRFDDLVHSLTMERIPHSPTSTLSRPGRKSKHLH